MRFLLGLLLLSPAFAAGDDLIRTEVSVLKLRSAASVEARQVTLQDVLVFGDADPRLAPAVGGVAVSGQLPGAGELVVSHDRVVELLQNSGVNMSRVLVQGALECRVVLPPEERAVATTAPAGTLEAGDDGLLARPPKPREPAAQASPEPATLAEALQSFVDLELATLGGKAEIEYELAGREFLELTSPPWEFRIRACGGNGLGLREFSVSLRRDGRVQRTVRFVARVRMIKDVLVAAHPLNVGAILRREDLKTEPMLLDGSQQLGVESPEQIIGQRVKRFVPANEQIRAADVDDGDLVLRSRPVAIVAGTGSVKAKFTGVALDSGGFGETIRVRIGDARKNRRELRGVITGLGTVELLEGGL